MFRSVPVGMSFWGCGTVMGRSSAIAADGIVGPVTIGAALGDGFDIGFVDGGEPAGSAILTGASALRMKAATPRDSSAVGPDA